MRNKIRRFSSGTTVIEVAIASSLTVIILGGVYSFWSVLAKSWMTERVQTIMNEELQVVDTAIKKDMRLSSGNEVYYYPQGSSPYTAVSFPIPVKDADNLITLDANQNIIWSKNVIYHQYANNGKIELRKTVTSPRDNTLTSSQRQQQLDSVVANGDASGTFEAANATTTTLIKDLKSFNITPSVMQFDEFSPVLSRTEFINFGSIVLTPGSHTLHFEVTGKNSASSGYFFGIDSLVFTPSGGEREAEEMLPPSASSGQQAENVDLSAVGSWSGNAQLLYHATAVGNYVELNFYYDEWIETNFNNEKALKDGTAVQFDTNITPHEIVLQLDGMRETWTADVSTASVSTPYDPSPPDLPSLQDMTLRTIVKLQTLSCKGARSRVLFRAHPTANSLRIEGAFIEEYAGGQNGISSTKKQLFFSNSPVLIGATQDMKTGAVGSGSDSISIPAGKEVYSNWADFPIDTAKDYLVTFYIKDDPSGSSASYYPGAATAVNSYYRTGEHADESTWGSTGTSFPHVVASVAIQTTYPAAGTWTSQIYDTKIANPSYGQLTWTDNIPLNTGDSISVRSSDDPEMADNPPWTDFASSPGSIPGSFTGRYIQFKANLTASSPYYDTALIKRVTIQWPGLQTLVNIGGYFSKDATYGTIKLTVDGQELSKAINVNMTSSQTYKYKEKTSTISSEVDPRNTR